MYVCVLVLVIVEIRCVCVYLLLCERACTSMHGRILFVCPNDPAGNLQLFSGTSHTHACARG